MRELVLYKNCIIIIIILTGFIPVMTPMYPANPADLKTILPALSKLRLITIGRSASVTIQLWFRQLPTDDRTVDTNT